jgi:YXWGXW repeat-containing protein
MKRTNALRNLSLSALLAASVFAAPAYAAVSLSINVGPPAPQYEVVPIMQPGYVWAPGYWGWTGDRHVWIRGRSIAQREGYRWEPDRWEQHDRGYVRTTGHWERDNGYRQVKMKNERHHEDRDNGNHGNGNRGHGNNSRHGGDN